MLLLKITGIFMQLIYLKNINADCDVFDSSGNEYSYNRYQYLYREMNCEHTEINTEIFSNYNNLEQISTIHITESPTILINPGKFHVLYNLKEVYIRNSEISEITKGVFSGFRYLKIIDISDNNISKIEMNSFSELNSLELLNISCNYLESTDFLGDDIKYTLNSLDVSYNKISYITDNFAFLATLKHLNLTANLIKSVNQNAFSNLNRLETLNLAENQLKTIPVGIFRDTDSLNYLNLSNNKFNFISLGTFAGLNSLNTIDLGYNKIKFLSPDILHDLHHISSFYINNNDISDLNADILLDHLPNLKLISLEGNNWTCNKLSGIIRSLRLKRVTLELGKSFKEKNINGIKCFGESENEAIKQTIDLNKNGKIEIDVEKLKRYFASEFKQSEFYNFFNNKFPKELEDSFKDAHFFKHVDDDFLNSKFYKYFAEGYINSTFFEYLDKKIETSKASHALENALYNKSDYEEIIKNSISEYFDSFKASNDYLKDVDHKENDNNAVLKNLNRLVMVLIFILVLIWVTLICKYWKINETKEFIAKFLKSRQLPKVPPSAEDQLL